MRDSEQKACTENVQTLVEIACFYADFRLRRRDFIESVITANERSTQDFSAAGRLSSDLTFLLTSLSVPVHAN